MFCFGFFYFSSSPTRACHSTQRQRTGSPFPEGVPAGHGVQPNGGVLLRTGPPLLAELHVQVQSYGGRGPETPVTPRMPQCVAPGRRLTQVRVQTHPTWQQAGFHAIYLTWHRDAVDVIHENGVQTLLIRLFYFNISFLQYLSSISW